MLAYALSSLAEFWLAVPPHLKQACSSHARSQAVPHWACEVATRDIFSRARAVEQSKLFPGQEPGKTEPNPPSNRGKDN